MSLISVWNLLPIPKIPSDGPPLRKKPLRNPFFCQSSKRDAIGSPGLEPAPVNEAFDYLAIFIIESKESFVFFHFWLPKLFSLKTKQRIIGFGFLKRKNKLG